MPKPDPALTVGLAVTVECSHFLAAKGASRSIKGRTLNLTAEERARRGEQGRQNLATRAAAKASA